MFLSAISLPSLTFQLWDLVFLATLIYGGYRGYQKGLLVELISFVGFLFTVFFAFKLIQLGFSASKVSSKATAFFLLGAFYIGCVVFVNWIGRILSDSLQYHIFDNIDHYIGIVLGLLKYTIALGIGLMLLTWTGFIDSSGGMTQTYLYEPLIDIVAWFIEQSSLLTPFVSDMVQGLRDILR